MKHQLLPEFHIDINENCIQCKKCVAECCFEALSFKNGKITGSDRACVACHRCTSICPTAAISVGKHPSSFRENPYWQPHYISGICKQANTGAKLLGSCGCDKPYPVYFDHLLLDACQVTNPSLDPLREPMEIRTHLGQRPESIKLEEKPGGGYKLAEKLPPRIHLDTPIMFAAMSYGAISLNAHRALAKAAAQCGTLMNVGEGGLHKDLYPYGKNIVVQCASGRFGVSLDMLETSAFIEIKIGQGAKPGIGGHVPGEKVDENVSATRMIPVGTDALSPAPHHDIYSIEDLRQLIFALKEATNYEKPVAVKVSAVHNIAPIVVGSVRAGADIIAIDGLRGSTGAAPTMIKNNVGIPIEIAIATVDERLRKENIRHRASIVAAGGIRNSADTLKAIALGADAVYIGQAALIAMGCRICQQCHTGKCAWGIATQRPELTSRLDPDETAQFLSNLVRGWSLEIKEMLGAMGVNALESVRGSRERLRGIGLTQNELEILGVKPAGR